MRFKRTADGTDGFELREPRYQGGRLLVTIQSNAAGVWVVRAIGKDSDELEEIKRESSLSKAKSLGYRHAFAYLDASMKGKR